MPFQHLVAETLLIGRKNIQNKYLFKLLMKILELIFYLTKYVNIKAVHVKKQCLLQITSPIEG